MVDPYCYSYCFLVLLYGGDDKITKYDVGEKVLVEGVIKNIKMDSVGLVYGIQLNGKTYNFMEVLVHPFIEGGEDNDKS